MKAKYDSHRQSRRSLYIPQQGALAETAVFVTLGAVGLITVLIAFGAASLPTGSTGENRVVKYIRYGQLFSDARSMGALVRYLLEPDSENPTLTNMPISTQINLIIPTNTSIHCAKSDSAG